MSDVTKVRRPHPQYLYYPNGEKPEPLDPELLAWLVDQLCSETRVHEGRTMSVGFITNQAVYELPAVYDALATAQTEAAELRAEVERLRNGTVEHACGHCGAKLILLDPRFLDELEKALHAAGAPNDPRLSLFAKIEALAQGTQPHE